MTKIEKILHDALYSVAKAAPATNTLIAKALADANKAGLKFDET